MSKGVLLAVVSVLLLQAWIQTTGMFVSLGPQEAASGPAFHDKSIHPLPDWTGQENLRPRRAPPEAGSQRRFKIGIPIFVLASLVFFLMWKLLQGHI